MPRKGEVRCLFSVILARKFKEFEFSRDAEIFHWGGVHVLQRDDFVYHVCVGGGGEGLGWLFDNLTM